MIPNLGSRFETPTLLGQGQMGTVWRAFDRITGRDVALKVLLAELVGDAEARLRFGEEFQLLASLRHERIVRVFDYLTLEDGTPAFTMELLSGEAIALQEPMEAERARELLLEALEGLAFLHARGFVHGDLSPANLRLGADGRLRLVDFGLRCRVGSRLERPRGTPRYLSPEMIRGDRLDGRADLYALGAVFYHALCAEPLFGDRPVTALIQAHLDEPAPGLGERCVGLPVDLESLVMNLLAKAPSKRPASAQAALRRLGVPGPAGALALSGAWVGRDPEVAFIEEALGASRPWLSVQGEAGSGKTRLLDELAARWQLRARRVLRLEGACGQDVVAQLRSRLESEALARDPQGAWQAWFEPNAQLDPRSALVRSQAACSALFSALGPEPIWLLLDDLEGFDEPSQRLLEGLRRSAATPWRVVATQTRSADPADLVLEPLSVEACQALGQELLGLEQPDAEFAQEATRASGGNPRRLEALLLAVLDAGAVRWRPAGGEIAADALSQAAARLDAAGAPSLAGLEGDARDLAGMLALRAQPMAVVQAARWLALDDVQMAGATAALLERDLVVRGPKTLALRSPAFGATVGTRLSAETLLKLHGRMADGLLSEPLLSEELPRLVEHLRGAGRILEALDPGLAAVAQHLGRYALRAAQRMLTWLLEVPQLDPARRAIALELGGDLHRLRGDLSLAESSYRLARELGGEPARTRLITSLALTRQMQSDFKEARELAREAAARHQDPAEAARAATTLARLHQLSGENEPARLAAEMALELARRAQSRAFEAEALGLLGYLAVTDPERSSQGLAWLERALALRTALGDQVGLNDATMFLGNAHLAAGRFRAARGCFQDNLALCLAIGSAPNDAITARINLGLVEAELGEASSARGHLHAACEAADADGDRFLASYARGVLARLEARSGDLARALALAAEATAIAEALEIPYLQLANAAHRVAVVRALGDPLGALRLAEETQALAKRLEIAEFDALLALEACRSLLSLDEVERAERVLRDGAAHWEAHAGYGVAALGLGAIAERASGTPANALETLGSACARAEVEGLVPILAELELERARAARDAGEDLGAAQAAQRALKLARDLGMDLLAFEAIATARGWVGSDPAELVSAREGLEAIARQLPPQEARRFRRHWDGMFGAGRREPASSDSGVARIVAEFGRMVTGTLRYEEVLDRVIDQVMAITGAERGMIFLVDSRGALSGLVVRPLAEPDQVELMTYSRSFIDAALISRLSVYSGDAQNDERFATAQSIMALDLRAVLCVPLIVEDAVIGLLYVDRRSINHAFGPTDLELVEGLAGFAGLAIANARRFEETQAHAQLLAALQDLSQLASRRLDRASLLARTLVQAVALSHAEQGWIASPQGDVLATWPEPAGDFALPLEDLARAAASLQATTCMGKRGTGSHQSGLVVPLVVDQEALAILCVVSDTEHRMHAPTELPWLEAIAAQAASALEVQLDREEQAARFQELEAAMNSPRAPEAPR